MITQTFYISTGRKNAMFTLRCRRDSELVNPAFMPDFYVMTLAADAERAIAKARPYVEDMTARMGGDREDFRIVFDPEPERDNTKRRGKLSVWATQAIEAVEAGEFPFGKHRGSRIEDAPASYVLFFADKLTTQAAADDAVTYALAAACMGVAAERGYLAKREVERAERAERDALSNFIGAVGERREFTGEVFSAFEKRCEYGGPSLFITKFHVGDDIVSYVGGKPLGEKGESITIRATIKRHEEYKGVKATQISRPTKQEAKQ